MVKKRRAWVRMVFWGMKLNRYSRSRRPRMLRVKIRHFDRKEKWVFFRYLELVQ